MQNKALFAAAAALFIIGDMTFGARLLGGSNIVLPHTFSAGTPARASEVNENLSAIASAFEARAIDVDARLDDAAPMTNVLRVSSSGTGFTSVAAALGSITDASATAPYLVEVGPGIFDETNGVVVPPFVTLRGSGPATTIRSTRTSASAGAAAATVQISSGALIQDLQIVNDGTSQVSSGVFGTGLSRNTLLLNVSVLLSGSGGTSHIGIHVVDSDLVVREATVETSGASGENVGIRSEDTGGPFAQPLLQDSRVAGRGFATGIGVQVTQTAMRISDCMIQGDALGIEAAVNGVTSVRSTRVATIGANPVYDAAGGASFGSAFTEFVGGNPIGNAAQFRYVHCVRPNLSPVVNGTGSSIL